MKNLIVGLVLGVLTVVFSYSILSALVGPLNIDTTTGSMNILNMILIVVAYAVVGAAIGTLVDKTMKKSK